MKVEEVKRITLVGAGTMGSQISLDCARGWMEEILATQKIDPPLTAGQEQAVEDILKEARVFYRKRGMISDDEWEAYRKVW